MSLALQKVKRLHLAAFCGSVPKELGESGSDRGSAPTSHEDGHEQRDDENEEQELRNDDPARNREKKKNEQKHQQHLLPPWWEHRRRKLRTRNAMGDDPPFGPVPNEKSPEHRPQGTRKPRFRGFRQSG
jgi:hypothetical protein